MLLRRITHHVKAQNWFAVALDFFIVVLGILIAFQITQWNDSRGDREREKKALQGISSDLKADIEGYDKYLSSSIDKITVIDYLLKNTGDGEILNSKYELEEGSLSFNQLIENSSKLHGLSLSERVLKAKNQLWAFAILVDNSQPSTAAFDSLLSSGELGILQNDAIVRSLQSYRLIVAALGKAQDTTYRQQRNTAIEVGHVYGLSVLGKMDDNQLFQLVSDNPQLRAILQTHSGWAKSHFLILSEASHIAEKLLKQIEVEL